VLWDPTVSATAHSALAGVLAGFAIACLVLVLVPFSERASAPPIALWEQRMRQFVVRFLVLAFAMLVVAAVSWGALSGFALTALEIPERCAGAPSAPGCTGLLLISNGYTSAVAVMVPGAMLLLLAISELALLTVMREHDHSQKSSQCIVFQMNRFLRHVYAVLLALAVWEVLLGASSSAAAAGWIRPDGPASWLPLAGAALAAFFFEGVSQAQGYGARQTCSGQPRPPDRVTRSRLSKFERRAAWALAVLSLGSVAAFSVIPDAPRCLATASLEVSAPAEFVDPNTIKTGTVTGVSQCVLWAPDGEGNAAVRTAATGVLVVSSVGVAAAITVLGLLQGASSPEPSPAPVGWLGRSFHVVWGRARAVSTKVTAAVKTGSQF
jgi:hypothetical protein